MTQIPSVPYRSRLEQDYACFLEMLRLEGTITAWKYEGLTFRLPGGARYTPDFQVQYPNGTMAQIEVKGWSRSYARSRMAWKIAAALWPCFQWLWVTRTKERTWKNETFLMLGRPPSE